MSGPRSEGKTRSLLKKLKPGKSLSAFLLEGTAISGSHTSHAKVCSLRDCVNDVMFFRSEKSVENLCLFASSSGV